jgi:hypothetical protein
MKKAALYARVSSDIQRQERTIESQLFELRKQIAAAGHVLIKEYVDDREGPFSPSRTLAVLAAPRSCECPPCGLIEGAFLEAPTVGKSTDNQFIWISRGV